MDTDRNIKSEKKFSVASWKKNIENPQAIYSGSIEASPCSNN